MATQSSSSSDASDASVSEAKSGLSGRELWEDVRIQPVEIALPGGVGLTLRAYRLSSDLTPTEIEVEEDDIFDARARARAAESEDQDEVIVDEEFAALIAEDDSSSPAAESADEPDEAEFVEADEESETEAVEEVPAFLSHQGKLITFKSAESLVSFIRSGAPHDLAQLDSWATVADRVQSSDIDPLPEDRYELDLVVENLRRARRVGPVSPHRCR